MQEEIGNVVVIGMGQIGLPTAAAMARAGFNVIGVDHDADRIKALKDGDIPFDEPGLRDLFDEVVDDHRLHFSVECPEADVFVVCVPATENIDNLKTAVRTAARKMHSGGMLLVESTMPPGTTMNHLLPCLTDAGWDPGVDFALAHTPERVAPGRMLRELVELDRLIGGLTAHCSERASAFYRRFVHGKLHVTDVTTAELVKVTENAYRDVNIAFANEVATVAHEVGANPFELIRLANTHPRVEIHRPGLGAGGHCLPASSRAFTGAANGRAHLTATAREINDATPSHLHRRIRQLTGESASVAFFGFAYKPDVDDLRASPGLDLYHRLVADDAFEVRPYDPVLEDPKLVDLDTALTGADIIVIGCGHTAFATLDPEHAASLVATKRIFDPTGTIDYKRWQRLGFHVVRR